MKSDSNFPSIGDDASFDEPLVSDKYQEKANARVGAVVAVQLSTVVGGLAGAASGAWLAWSHAPQVGAAWWPYIRVAVAVGVGVIGLKVGALLAALAAALVGLLIMTVIGR